MEISLIRSSSDYNTSQSIGYNAASDCNKLRIRDINLVMNF